VTLYVDLPGVGAVDKAAVTLACTKDSFDLTVRVAAPGAFGKRLFVLLGLACRALTVTPAHGSIFIASCF
jgi:hypothetical protein